MSDLQLALIGAGVLAVLGVWAYNHWQERGLRRPTDDLFLGGGDRPSASDATSTAEADAARAEPMFAEPAPAADEPPVGMARPDDVPIDATPAALPTDTHPADALIDCIVSFSPREPIAPAAVWAAQALWNSTVSKPLRWLAADAGDIRWTAVDPASSARFGHWIAALQLVDRRGPVSDAEIGRFFEGIRALGKSFDFTPMLPSRAETMLRASELDGTCASVDVQFALHVIHAQGGAFAGPRLRTVCEASGLELDGVGHYVSRDADGHVEFSLSNMGSEPLDASGLSSLATNGVVLSIDVPLAADGIAAFDRMLLAARQLAMNLGGVVVDSQRAPLSDAMLGLIRQKIAELQQTMRDAGVPPGGLRARRLFA